jgi:GNAT superfamily N-acetyltransferase
MTTDHTPTIHYSDQPADLDFAAIHGWLTTTYWSPGISRALVEQGFANSRLVMGAFAGGRQVGVARALTDTTRFGYVLDVFVDEAFRGQGIARAMVQRLVDHPAAAAVRTWTLLTRDAQPVYRGIGFATFEHPDRFMVLRKAAPA